MKKQEQELTNIENFESLSFNRGTKLDEANPTNKSKISLLTQLFKQASESPSETTQLKTTQAEQPAQKNIPKPAPVPENCSPMSMVPESPIAYRIRNGLDQTEDFNLNQYHTAKAYQKKYPWEPLTLI